MDAVMMISRKCYGIFCIVFISVDSSFYPLHVILTTEDVPYYLAANNAHFP